LYLELYENVSLTAVGNEWLTVSRLGWAGAGQLMTRVNYPFGAPSLGQTPFKIGLSLCNWSFEEIVVSDQCLRFVWCQSIDVTVLESAACESELLCCGVDQDFAIYEQARIEAPK
jgi:hypothetical protein